MFSINTILFLIVVWAIFLGIILGDGDGVNNFRCTVFRAVSFFLFSWPAWFFSMSFIVLLGFMLGMVVPDELYQKVQDEIHILYYRAQMGPG